MKVVRFLKIGMGKIRNRIVEWWHGRTKAWKVFLGIGAALAVINESVSLCNYIRGEPERTTLAVFTKEEECKVSPPDLVPYSIGTNHTKETVFDGEDVGFILQKMATAYNVDRDYEGAKKYGDILTRFFETLDKDDRRFDNEKLCVLSAQMQEAFFAKDYNQMIAHYNNMCSITSAVHMMNVALFDVAKLRISGKRLFFFSPDQLGELRKWDRQSCEDYLSYIANWGYLQPLMIDQLAKIHRTFYYEDYFNLGKCLPYKPCMRVVSTNALGETVYSNEATLQWIGRDEFEPVDIDKCVAETLGLRDEEIQKHPIKLTVERTKADMCRSRWEIEPESGIATGTTFKVEGRAKWKSGINKENLLNGKYIATRTIIKTVPKYYVPNHVWLIIAILVFMAFSNGTPPTKKRDEKEES